MWVMRKLFAPRVVSRRSISLVAVALMTAVFVVLGPLIRPVTAESATWNGDQLTYEGNTYAKEGDVVSASDSRNRAGEVAYTWVETTSSGAKKAHTIFFDNASDIQAKDKATLIIYDYTPPSTYKNASSPTTLDIRADLLGDQVDNDTELGTSCSSDVFGGLGWILCAVSQWLADAVDQLYELVASFLDVPPITTNSSDNAMYDVWKVMLTIANVCFAIAFIIVIFSQITGAGFSNYSLKSMLPRLVIAAILVNISYWICALAIDLSNIFGHSIQAIFVNIRENISISNTDALNAIDFTNVTTAILSGGAVVAGGITISMATAGSASSLGFMILAALVSVVFAVFVAFVILAARQALITVFTVISPLAFVAYILPNTEEYFTKWRKSFMTLLLFFPIFALVFGGSQLAGTILIQQGITTNRLEIIILGLVVQGIALFITPLIVNFSQGLLGRFAGIVNDRTKGPLDRFRNWANENAEVQASERRAAVADKIRAHQGKRGVSNRIWQAGSYLTPGGMSAHAAMAKHNRDARKAINDDFVKNTADLRRQELSDAAEEKRRNNGSLNAFERARAIQRDREISSTDLKFRADKYQERIAEEGKELSQSRLIAKNEDGSANQGFDQQLHGAVQSSTVTAANTERMEKEFAAIVDEWKAGRTGYDAPEYAAATRQFQEALRGAKTIDAANRMKDLHFAVSQETERATSAQHTAQAQVVTEYKENEAARIYAGGIDEHGATRVFASAKSQLVETQLKNIENSRSLLSDYTSAQLLTLQETGVDKSGKNVSSNVVLRDAAMREIMLSKGNNWSYQKIKDQIAIQHGMIQDEDGMYYTVERDANKNVIMEEFTRDDGTIGKRAKKGARITDQSVIERNIDVQQLLVDSIGKSHLKLAHVSGTDQANMGAGTFIETGQDSIVRDIGQGKFGEDRWVSMDIDELMRTLQIVRDPRAFDSLGDKAGKARADMMASIDQALENPYLRGKIKERERGMMSSIASYLDPRDTRTPKEKENTYLVNDHGGRASSLGDPGARVTEALVKAPKYYKYNRFNDFKDGAGAP